ncbi:ssDNA endonuclease and repair protein rad10 [Rhizina undulata]
MKVARPTPPLSSVITLQLTRIPQKSNQQRLNIPTFLHIIPSRVLQKLPCASSVQPVSFSFCAVVLPASFFNTKTNALPAGLLQEIVSHLFGPDLNSSRLVCHALSAASNICKFRALRVCVTRRGLDNLLNVSRQPELARCVREITYPHNLLAPMQESKLVRYHWFRPEFSEYKPFLKSFFECYNGHYIAQTELENSGKYHQTLEKALSRMDNIRAIVPGNFNEYGHFELYRNWLKTLTETDMTFVSEISGIHRIILTDTVLEYSDQTRVLKAVIDLVITLHRQGCKLDRFERGYTGIWCEIYSKSSGLWNCASLFQDLTSLHICISTSANTIEDTTAIKQYAKEGRLYQFISFAPNLRKLSLEINGYLFPDSAIENPEISLRDMLGHRYVWERLHTFTLKFPQIDSEDLVEFLGHHAKTLKYLQFIRCSLLNGTWREMMDCLKGRINLTDFNLDSASQIVVDVNGRRRECVVWREEEDEINDYVLMWRHAVS